MGNLQNNNKISHTYQTAQGMAPNEPPLTVRGITIYRSEQFPLYKIINKPRTEYNTSNLI